MKICPDEKCFGCCSCADICPAHAITIDFSKGFYRPIVDETICKNCNLCKTICPSNNKINIKTINPKSVKCFAAYSKNITTHFECTSGGICTELSKQFITDNGIVIGAYWNQEKELVQHRICETEQELSLIAKSKYVQSKMAGIYNAIEGSKNKILFIGVPCQVYALKHYLKSKNIESKKQLYYIDLLCRGGASPKCFKEHIDYIKQKTKQSIISNISFRGGNFDCNLVLKNNKNKIIYCGSQFVDPYFNYFMEHVIFQPRCYECPFAGKQRIGDLTVGDFWGLQNDLIPQEGGHGINMIFVNTENGQKLLDSIKDNITIFKRPAEEAIAGNDTLKEPTEKHEEYNELWHKINTIGFVRALDFYKYQNYETRYKVCHYRLIRKKIKDIIKLIIPSLVIDIYKNIKTLFKNDK